MDTIPTGADPSRFFSDQLSLREKLYEDYRIQARDIYDEIVEVRALAGDVFMNRYQEKGKKEKKV